MGASSSTSMVGKMLMRGGGEKGVERRIQTEFRQACVEWEGASRDQIRYGYMAEITIQSWKADQKGGLHTVITKESTILPIGGLHGRFLNFLTKDGDPGAVIVDRYGSFVGFYSAGNDYTGAGYFIPADRLSADIKYITKASDVDVLWKSWLR